MSIQQLRTTVLILIACAFLHEGTLPSATSEEVPAAKRHNAEVKGIKSANGDVEAKMQFHNNSQHTIKVYWLDYNGNRKYYNTLKSGTFYEQSTFLTHPWLITDENDSAWYVYFPDAQPRIVKIVSPYKE